MAQAAPVNRQGSCVRGGGSVRAQTEVQWLGLETLNWGAGTLARRQWKQSSSRNGGGSDTGTQGTAAAEVDSGHGDSFSRGGRR